MSHLWRVLLGWPQFWCQVLYKKIAFWLSDFVHSSHLLTMVNFFTAATAVVAFAAAGSQAAPAAEKLTVPQQNALDQHNMYRKKHSAPPLVWDAKLAEYAQKWSDGCDFKHSGGPYGENVSLTLYIYAYSLIYCSRC